MGRSPAHPSTPPGVVQLTLKPPGPNFPFGRGKLDSLAALGKGEKQWEDRLKELGKKNKGQKTGWPGR